MAGGLHDTSFPKESDVITSQPPCHRLFLELARTSISGPFLPWLNTQDCYPALPGPLQSRSSLAKRTALERKVLKQPLSVGWQPSCKQSQEVRNGVPVATPPGAGAVWPMRHVCWRKNSMASSGTQMALAAEPRRGDSQLCWSCVLTELMAGGRGQAVMYTRAVAWAISGIRFISLSIST